MQISEDSLGVNPPGWSPILGIKKSSLANNSRESCVTSLCVHSSKGIWNFIFQELSTYAVNSIYGGTSFASTEKNKTFGFGKLTIVQNLLENEENVTV